MSRPSQAEYAALAAARAVGPDTVAIRVALNAAYAVWVREMREMLASEVEDMPDVSPEIHPEPPEWDDPSVLVRRIDVIRLLRGED